MSKASRSFSDDSGEMSTRSGSDDSGVGSGGGSNSRFGPVRIAGTYTNASSTKSHTPRGRGGQEDRYCGHGLDTARLDGGGRPLAAGKRGGGGVIDVATKPIHTVKNASSLSNPLPFRNRPNIPQVDCVCAYSCRHVTYYRVCGTYVGDGKL